MAALDPNFPYSLTISIPLPSHHLASSALRALQVDQELSPLVRRTFSLTKPESTSAANGVAVEAGDVDEGPRTVLQTAYEATTNRMLRVAVNAFMDSLGVVLDVMEELDVGVLSAELGR